MKVLVFDTETTGLPIGKNPSIIETDKWPYIVQLSYVYYDTVKKIMIESRDYIIKIPNSVVISSESIAIHKITPEICDDEGVSIKAVLDKFNACLQDCDVVVGHNISFDKRLVMVESIRHKMKQHFTTIGVRVPEYCTMKNSVDLCKIPVTSKEGKVYFKYPKLSELHQHLFKSVPCGLHNALIDVLVCLRCYVMMEHKYDITIDGDTVLEKMFRAYCI
jgi:DNA polymerase III subunit epsilon